MNYVTTLPDFLASTPPGETRSVNYLVRSTTPLPGQSKKRTYLNVEDIRIDCTSPECDGLRNFTCSSPPTDNLAPKERYFFFLDFTCRNCMKSNKTYAIAFEAPLEGGLCAQVLKLGETPQFGARVPSRVISLIGPDKDAFLKGRRAENQGLAAR